LGSFAQTGSGGEVLKCIMAMVAMSQATFGWMRGDRFFLRRIFIGNLHSKDAAWLIVTSAPQAA
jgi:hypothetical protein